MIESIDHDQKEQPHIEPEISTPDNRTIEDIMFDWKQFCKENISIDNKSD